MTDSSTILWAKPRQLRSGFLKSLSSAALIIALLPCSGRGQDAALAQAATQQESLLIGPGDVLSLRVFDEPELTQTLRVTDAGDVPVLLIGSVHVGGMTPGMAAATIEQQFVAKQFLLHPRVSVTVDQFITQNVSVIGQVKSAGAYAAPTGRTITEVIAQAGGLLETADRHLVIRRRVGGQEVPFYFANSASALLSDQPIVYPGDTVFIPRAGTIYVLGDVGRPGGYVMNNDRSQLTALQVLAVAGGAHQTAKLSHARLVRQGAAGTKEIELPLDDMRKGRVPDMPLLADDIVYVPFSYVKNVAVSLPLILSNAAAASIYVIK